jgi:calpain-15
MLLTRELSFIEFKGFFECLEKSLDASFFKSQILQNYSSSEKGLSLKGFIDYFRDSITSIGEEAVWKWFEKLGYDRDLYSIRSRTFMLTVHSSVELSITVRDAIQTDLDNRAHIFSVSNIDEFTQIENLHVEHQGVRALSCYNRIADAFTLVAVNDLTYPVEMTIDASESAGCIFSTKNGSVRKVPPLLIMIAS